jgi:hypothetical protein
VAITADNSPPVSDDEDEELDDDMKSLTISKLVDSGLLS